MTRLRGGDDEADAWLAAFGRAGAHESRPAADPADWLAEHGFTGTDRLGRKWVDGKEVKGDGAGQSAAPAHAYPAGYTPPKSLSPGVNVGPNPKLSPATRPALSAPEADAVTAYTDVGVYRAINEALKTGGPLPRPGALRQLLGAKNVGGVHDQLQAAFAKAPVAPPPPMVLKRGVFSRNAEKLGQHFLSSRGKVVTLPGYQSTSAVDAPEGTDAFTAPGGGYKGNVKFTIHAVHGLDVRPYSKFPAEDEVLLNHGAEYQVGRVEKRGDEWHVELFQLPPKGAQA